MRISDWSSYVCSSHLSSKPNTSQSVLNVPPANPVGRKIENCALPGEALDPPPDEQTKSVSAPAATSAVQLKIVRATCRARVCPHESISVVAVYFNNNNYQLLHSPIKPTYTNPN